MAKQKTIEEKYKEMSELDHILHRPSMYVGSTKEETAQLFLYNTEDGKMTFKEVNYVPAMLKIIDEVISNSCDEYRRDSNLGLNQLQVSIDKGGKITVRDNGGIAVVIHKGANCYLPEFIFGRLRTSSNYDDSEDRNVIGTNGVGSSLCNIFSTKFEVTTADSKNKITVKWKGNMKECIDHGTPQPSKDHFTETTFNVDFSKFDINYKEFTEEFVDILEKRCIDSAAANLGLTVKFIYTNGKTKIRESKWKFKKFEDYIELYSEFIDLSQCISFEDNLKRVWVYPDGNINVGFVNGAECSKGTHFKGVRQFINNSISEYMKKKHKIDVTAKGIDNKYSMFGDFQVSNPNYTSQTKEELTTPVDKFSKNENFKFEVPDNFLVKINKSEIIEIVLDWFKKKSEAEDAAKIRKLNRESKKLLRSDKFINCNSKKREEKQLWIYEGDSAASGHRGARDPMTQAAYLMRGVPKNVIEASPTEVMKNQVFNDIVNIISLQWGEYNKADKLSFGKIIIASDADPDGDKIACLLMVFFNHFPELFEQGLIYRCNSPIIVAKDKKGISHAFYSFDEWNKTNQSKFTTIKHIKGLGTQNIKETKEMMKNPHLIQITKDNMTDMMLGKWFGKGIAQERKNMLKDSVEG
jgi:DNA topoisomerase-2